MFMKRDYRYGIPYYKFVGDTSSTDMSTIFSNSRFNTIFSGIYTSRKYTNSSGQSVVAYENVGFTNNEAATEFQAEFQNCQWMVPFYFNSDEGNTAALARIKSIVDEVIDENAYKYVKMVETLGFVYDPIKDFMESGRTDGGTTYGGTEAIGRVYDSVNRVMLMEASGPIQTYTFANGNLSLTLDSNKTVDVKNCSAESVERGKKISGLDNQSPSVIDGTTQKDTQYTTSYDDDTDGRKQAYATSEGTTSDVVWNNTKSDVPIMGKVQAGSPNAINYTDTKSFTNRTDTRGDMYSKEGRHVPAQELIEVQRKIAQFSVEKEFFNDLKKKLLIAGWD